MNDQIENWKKQVMDSLEGMERATPNPFLLAKIRSRIRTSAAAPLMRPAAFRLAVACLAVLFALNISALVKASRSGLSKSAAEYSYGTGFSPNFNLYE